MDTLTFVIIINSLTLAGVAIFVILFYKAEKINRNILHVNFDELKDIMVELKNLSINTASDICDRFNDLRKEIKVAQDQANSKINTGLERFQSESKEIRKETLNHVSKLQTTIKDYSDDTVKLLQKYLNDSFENQKETSQLKQQIQQELQNILKEIKAPLDLD